MEPWYKVATPRKEVREGRSFHPDEFAIALEQVVAGTAPKDYTDPAQFFSRTCFTKALKEHAGMVLKRLSGKTESAAPVLTLVTQFGGGKTHTLTALYHLVKNSKKSLTNEGVRELLRESGLTAIPEAKVAVFVGNAWDPQEGRETPWIDIARQLANEAGVKVLGPTSKTNPPGTEALYKLFAEAKRPVLILMDEVLNFFNRHREMADPCYAFFDNLVRALTGVTSGAALISLPRSRTEMTDYDIQWQDKITRAFRRVAKDLIANDEAEISEVVRRRLFEDIGEPRARAGVAKAFADWCFDRRAQLPPEWTAVDTAATEAKAKDFLRMKFETCFPFHPSTLTVFQRKWQSLTQYQQTRGTLAMLAQWISKVYVDDHRRARNEPLITLGSAPLDISEFRAVVLGQLGEPKLEGAISTDISGLHSQARALDADTKGQLRDIHQRVAKAMLFESSGGMVDKVAHLPELRFALGEPGMDTTSIDNASDAFERRAFFLRKVGTDGYHFGFKPTLKKVVNDRRASLDNEEVKRACRALIKKEFEKGACLPLSFFPEDSETIQDTPKLTLVVMDPSQEWEPTGKFRDQLSEWTKQRGKSPRLYPGSLVWCLKKPGRNLKDKVELFLAWKRVEQESQTDALGQDLEKSERVEISVRFKEAEEIAREEVWAEYRHLVISDHEEGDGLKIIDLGAGHASAGETLTGRVITALKSQGLLNESVGASYLDRNWPRAFQETGAWPLQSLRQSFLNGALTRLLDPDETLRSKIIQFVSRGELGLASNKNPDGTFANFWFETIVPPDEVSFESDVYLLKKTRALALKSPKTTSGPEGPPSALGGKTEAGPPGPIVLFPEPPSGPPPTPPGGKRLVRITGGIPPEVWNRVGTKLIPKLKSSGIDLRLNLNMTVMVEATQAEAYLSDLRQVLSDLGLTDRIKIEIT